MTQDFGGVNRRTVAYWDIRAVNDGWLHPGILME